MTLTEKVYLVIKNSDHEMTVEEIAQKTGLSKLCVSGLLPNLCSQKKIFRELRKQTNSNRRVFVYQKTKFVVTDTSGVPVEQKKSDQQRAQPARKQKSDLELNVLTPNQESAINLATMIESLGHQMSEMIAASICNNLKPVIEKRVADLLSHLVPADPIEKPKNVVKEKLPRIGVIGFLSIQNREIAKQFESLFDIKFWSTGESHSLLKSICGTCEAVFVHVKHMSHSADAIVKNSKTEIVRVPGGAAQMISAIENYWIESQEK